MSDKSAQRPSGEAVSITTRMKVKPTDLENVAPLLSKLTVAGSKFSGHLNAEVSPPAATHSEWITIQRFGTEEDAVAWRDSSARKELQAQLSPYLHEQGIADETSQENCDVSVAACISTVIKPGLEEEYYEWLQEIQTAQAIFPGYQGTYVQMTKTGETNLWTTILRFDTQESLDDWFTSKRRIELVEKAKRFVSSESIKRLTSSFPGWLPLDDSGEAPANWKAAVLVVLGLYPIVCLEIKFLSPALKSLNLAVANFIGNTISVALVTWLTMPFLTTVFRKWLLPPKGAERTQVEMVGGIVILALFAIEIFIFQNVFR
ncbi:MAG TPA: antibiotic biosynthesis monooxygenase [Drouetiella sp.]